MQILKINKLNDVYELGLKLNRFFRVIRSVFFLEQIKEFNEKIIQEKWFLFFKKLK